MIDELSGILLFLLLIGIAVLWVRALSESDGRCHYEDCEGCPYSGWCEEQERKESMEEKTDESDFNQQG